MSVPIQIVCQRLDLVKIVVACKLIKKFRRLIKKTVMTIENKSAPATNMAHITN